MRTDTERLDFIFAAMGDPEGELAERMQAAYTLELRGRAMVDAAMGAKLVEPGAPMPELTALDLAVAELGRIRNVKGFSEERDDAYQADDLAYAAVTYITPAEDRCDGDGGPDSWPWDSDTFKPSPDDRKRELTKGIALALCELDRLIRAERREEEAQVRMEREQESRRPQAAATREFKVGDQVRVMRRGTWIGWVDEMYAYVGNGKAYEIAEADQFHARIDGWYFPLESLEHVDG